ncbi:MAG: DNA repair protein RecO [Weeksellaceae bacterium]|nr:DNA repair protein RecO [Weeksellaceae bacterium]
MIKTQGLVLKSLKYGDTSLILHCFCREGGMQSFLIKGYYRAEKKKQKRVLPLSEIELYFHENATQNLHNLYSLDTTNHRPDISSQPIKSMVVQLIAEMLYLLLKTQSTQENLYDFLIKSLTIYYHKPKNHADFHIWLISQILQITGFAPNLEGKGTHFSLLEGQMISYSQAPFLLNEEETVLWKQLFHSEFTSQSPNFFTREQRQSLTQMLLQWCEIHIPDFKKPQSIDILKEILH